MSLLKEGSFSNSLSTLTQISSIMPARCPIAMRPAIEAERDPKEDLTLLLCFASTKIANDDMPQTYAFALPQIEGYFSGVGDLFSALLLGFYNGISTPLEEFATRNRFKSGDIAPASHENTDHRTSTELTPFAAAVSKALMGVQLILLKTHLWSLRRAEASRATGTGGKDVACGDLREDEDCLPFEPELDSTLQSPVDQDALSGYARTAREMRVRELRIVQEKDVLLKLAEKDAVGWPATRLDWASLLQVEGLRDS